MTRMMRKFAVQSTLVAISCAMVLFIGGTCVWAGVPVGTFREVEGSVDVMRDGALPAVAVKAGDAVQVGDFVRTRSNSRAEIAFKDGNLLKIAPRTRIDISQYLGTDEGDKRTLRLPRGKVQAVVPPKAKEEKGGAKRFEIHTPNAVAGVRGTNFFVFHDRNVTGVVVREGKVYTYNASLPQQLVTVPAGATTTVGERRPPQAPRPAAPAELQLHDRDVTPAPAKKEEKASGPTGKPAGEPQKPAGAAGNTPDQAPSGKAGGEAAPTGGERAAAAGTASSPQKSSTDSPSATPGAAPAAAAPPSGPPSYAPPVTVADLPTAMPAVTTPTAPPIQILMKTAEEKSVLATTGTTNSPGKEEETPPITETEQVKGEIEEQMASSGGLVTPSLSETIFTTDPSVPPPVSNAPVTDPNAPVAETNTTTGTSGTTTSSGSTAQPFALLPVVATLLVRENTIDPNSNLLLINSPGDVNGQVGLMQAPWSGTSVPLQVRGTSAAFAGGGTVPHYWQQRLTSGDKAAGTSVTPDGGGIYGYLAGIDRPALGLVQGELTAIYVDPTGRAGIIRGDFGSGGAAAPTGLIDAATGNWTADGSARSIEINPAIGIVPATLANPWWQNELVTVDVPVTSQNASSSFGPESEGGFLDPSFNTLGSMSDRGDKGEFSFLKSDPSFGIWQLESFGAYAAPGSRFVLMSDAEWGATAASPPSVENLSEISSIGAWGADGRLTGTSYGVWGDWNAGRTRVMTGTLIGTANTGAGTFGAIATGSWLETGTFLTNLTLAQQLGFPVTPVAGLILSGATSAMSVNASGIRFFAHAAGDPVTLWATNAVSGSYSGSLQLHSSVPLTDGTGAVSGKFHLLNAGTSPLTGQSVWLGEIEGMGTIPLGTGGFLQSSFDGIAAGTFSAGTFAGTAAGTGHPLTHLARIGGGFGQADFRSLTNGPPPAYATESQLTGLLGGISLWNTTKSSFTEVTLTGVLSAPFTSSGQLLIGDLSSYDRISNTGTTRDGGAYWAYLSGANNNVPVPPPFQQLTTRFSGLYIDPAGHAGILLGGLDGFVDQQSLTVDAHGGILPTELAATSPIAATALNQAAGITTATTPLASLFPGDFSTGGLLTPASGGLDSLEMRAIAGISDWGIARFTRSGTYSGTTDNLWKLPISGPGGTIMLEGGVFGNSWDPVTHRNGGFATFAFADISATPRAGIVVGETVGTFDPVGFTWQMVMSGAWLDAARIVSLASTAAGQATLQRLNIPAFEIGSADLSGSGGVAGDTLAVNMAGVKFLAPTTGGRPTVWATGSVGGNYAGNPIAAGTITLNQIAGSNASGVQANFTMSSFSGGTWQGKVSGPVSGTVGGHTNINMTGLAAGSYNAGTGTISGMAAGLVK